MDQDGRWCEGGCFGYTRGSGTKPGGCLCSPWQALRNMDIDNSWAKSAGEYIKLYQELRAF